MGQYLHAGNAPAVGHEEQVDRVRLGMDGYYLCQIEH
jgi:hypothetical protein